MHAPHQIFEPLFNKHRTTRGLECEFRLGKKNNKFFDTNVGDETFFAIKKALEKYEGWEKVEAEEYEVYNASGGRRTIYQDGDIKCSEIKTPWRRSTGLVRISLLTLGCPSPPRRLSRNLGVKLSTNVPVRRHVLPFFARVCVSISV